VKKIKEINKYKWTNLKKSPFHLGLWDTAHIAILCNVNGNTGKVQHFSGFQSVYHKMASELTRIILQKLKKIEAWTYILWLRALQYFDLPQWLH
jgi:hypothetical protein